VISSGQQRALLLGDAITCPLQLDEPDWHSIGDVDLAMADRTRERMWRELEGEHTIGTGAHFPELRFGRILPGSARRWLSPDRMGVSARLLLPKSAGANTQNRQG
jgi:hypothetical protein